VSDFSREPEKELSHAVEQGYVGIYFQQGVPILDRDLNLLQDLVASTVRSIVRRYIGDGIPPDGAGFEIRAIPADNDFVIKAAGTCLVGGIEVAIDKDKKYSDQPGVDKLAPPTGGDPRVDLVYLDVSLVRVESGDGLDNADDIGIQTSVRVKPAWTVKVAVGPAQLPDPPPPGHFLYKLATVTRPANVNAIEQKMISDERQTGINLADVESRISEVERLRIQLSLGNKSGEFSPRNGRPNDPVTIFGNNLDIEGVEVHFGDFKAPVMSAARDQLKVLVPPDASAGPVHITVESPGGKAESKLAFQIQALGEAPIFKEDAEFTPTFGVAGDQVTLNGKNFLNASLVQFNGARVTPDPAQVSDTKIVVNVPPDATGSHPISVTTPVATTTSNGLFTVGEGPAFSDNAFTPRNGQAGVREVTITGTHFDTQPVKVTFSAVQGPATKDAPVPNPSPNQIKVTVPAGLPAGAYRITVTTGIGSKTADPTFNIQ
jgi:uncharacterized protein (TIGR03437 family)